MFIGLNPSKADEVKPDNTITKVCKIAAFNGYGGIYMVNCFSFITPDPDQLITDEDQEFNDRVIFKYSGYCPAVVFAWGNFPVLRSSGRPERMMSLFPNAYALAINKNGSPKHPLYCRDETTLIKYPGR